MEKFLTLCLLSLLLLSSCKRNVTKNETPKILCTTTMITDLVKNIVADSIEINSLMGPGIDPHLYKASEGDLNKLSEANIIFYNGLHLEGKITDILGQMKKQGKKVISIGDALPKEMILESSTFSGNYDPHIWFDINNWKLATEIVTETLAKEFPNLSNHFENQKTKYLLELNHLKLEVKKIVNEVPKEKRILVTAHDAFSYFGRSNDFEVIGLQGLSTATEAGVKDIQNLSKLIIAKKVASIFVETSVSPATIEALQAAVKDKGYNVKIGGKLYSDALGSAGSIEGTYIGMYQYNTKTIIESLK